MSDSNVNIHDAIKLRLNDQFKQNLEADLISSSRFNLLLNLNKDQFQISKYLKLIEDPDIRLIFTRLRIDVNALSTSKIRKNVLDNCPICGVESETVKHFITKCSDSKDERDIFLYKINEYVKNNDLER